MQRVTTASFIHHFVSHNAVRFTVYSYSTSAFSSDAFANYLFHSLGFSQQQALSASNRLERYRKLNDPNLNTSAVTFFRNTICPKLKFLHSHGFSGPDLIRVISVNPNLLLSGSESCILSAVCTLRDVLVSDTHVLAVLTKLCVHSVNGVTKYLMLNVDLLTSYGIPIELIRKHVLRKPLAFLQSPEVFRDVVISVEKKLGFPLDSPRFLYSVILVSGRCKANNESKCRMFKSFGWTQSDFDTFMMENPCCFAFSDATIKKKLDFLMNKLRLKPAYLISNPVFLTCNLEKIIMPRRKVLLILKEKGLLIKYPSLSSVICMTESRFLDTFVLPFKEVHEAYAKQIGCSMKSLTQKRADSLQSSTTSDSFANYLVESLGFTHQQALSTSARLSKYRKVKDFNFEANAISVVSFLKKHGFDDNHIIKLVSYYPRVLCSNVANTLFAKLQFLQAQGFSGSDFIRVFSSNPKFLIDGSQSSISSVVQILRQVLIHDSHVIGVLSKLRRNTIHAVIKYLMSNIDLLTSYGLPIELIRKHILYFPFTFLRNPENFKVLVTRVENNLGIVRDAPMFLYGIQLLSNFREKTIESKCRVFMSFGWTQSDVDIFLRKHANCLTLSEARIKKKLDFLMNELRLEPAYLTSHSKLLTYSLEKTIVPRHNVFLILKKNDLMKKYPSLNTAVAMSEPYFFKRRHFLKRLSEPIDIVNGVEIQIGIARVSSMFLYGIHLSKLRVETIESNCRVFKSFGWTQSDVEIFMMKYHCHFTMSDVTIEKKLDFLMGELRFKPDYSISEPAFFL